MQRARQINLFGLGQRIAAVWLERILRGDHKNARRVGRWQRFLRQHYLEQVQRVICFRKTLSPWATAAQAPRTVKKERQCQPPAKGQWEEPLPHYLKPHGGRDLILKF